MCGIVASLSTHPAELALRMGAALNSLAHRGPNAQGLKRLLDGRVWLGHRRLSLVDVEGGGQPIANEDESVFAVVNGEIYDDARLRRDLESKGHNFRTGSDSEVLIHLYEEHGNACVELVRGELAFVLFDIKRGRILAGRDRFGIKPLHWSIINGRLSIASEVKALVALGLRPNWDLKSVCHALTHQYLPPSRSLVSGVHVLPPGHFLTAALGEPPEIRCYYEFFRSERYQDGPEQASLEVRMQLEEAVKLRLRSEVPVGAYLSGGLDSTAVVALAAREYPGLCTFGVSFERSPWDEARLAEESARELGVDFEPVRVSQRDLIDHLEEAVWFSEGLAINGQLVAKHRLAKAARAAGIVAVLTGEGADEAYLGYPHLRFDHYGAASERPCDAIARGVMTPTGDKTLSLAEVRRVMGFVPSFVVAKAGFCTRLVELLEHDVRADLGDPFRALFEEIRVPNGTPVECSAWLWTKLALGGYIVRTLGDGTEMAYSIEGRPPFLDHVLFEHAWSLPVSYRLDACGREKAALRDAMRDVIPEAVRLRPKQPFLAPPVLTEHFDDARELLLDVVSHAPFFDAAMVHNWINGLVAATHEERALADPAWTMLTTAGLLGRTLGLADVEGELDA